MRHTPMVPLCRCCWGTTCVRCLTMLPYFRQRPFSRSQGVWPAFSIVERTHTMMLTKLPDRSWIGSLSNEGLLAMADAEFMGRIQMMAKEQPLLALDLASAAPPVAISDAPIHASSA